MIHQGQSSRGRSYQISDEWVVSIPDMGISNPISDVRGGMIYAGRIQHQRQTVQFLVEPAGAEKPTVQRLWDEKHRAEREAREADPMYQRRGLVATLDRAMERAYDAKHETGDWERSQRIERTEVEPARSKLAEFDAAHPETAEAARAERQAEREAEETRKRTEYEQSFIGRGID